MKILGLDYGSVRIGVALSEEEGKIAFGRGTILRKSLDEDLKQIEEIVKEEKAVEIVVGLPLKLNGSKAEQAEEAERFAGELKERIGLPVKLWDERLSTAQAERVLLQADLRRKKRKKVIDKVAAQIILQSYLDAKEGTKAQRRKGAK